MAANADSQRSSLQRLELELQLLSRVARVPEEPDLAGLEREVRSVLARLELPVELVVRGSTAPPLR